jgi:hypothetical protein
MTFRARFAAARRVASVLVKRRRSFVAPLNRFASLLLDAAVRPAPTCAPEPVRRK